MIQASSGTRQGHVRGFTLIELLVVIAIIGILSSVVLASLNTARNKGADTAVKSNLAGARAQAELFYDANGNNYVVSGGAGTATDLCALSGSASGVRGINSAVLAAGQAYSAAITTVNATLTTGGTWQTATCHASTGGSGEWAAEAPLKASASGAGNARMFCVDSSGHSMETTANLGASETQCS